MRRDDGHQDRREDARQELLEKAKERLLLAQEVLADWFEGVDTATSARRRNKGRQTIWRFRVWLGVQNKRVEPRSKSPGRLGNRREIEGVRP